MMSMVDEESNRLKGMSLNPMSVGSTMKKMIKLIPSMTGGVRGAAYQALGGSSFASYFVFVQTASDEQFYRAMMALISVELLYHWVVMRGTSAHLDKVTNLLEDMSDYDALRESPLMTQRAHTYIAAVATSLWESKPPRGASSSGTGSGVNSTITVKQGGKQTMTPFPKMVVMSGQGTNTPEFQKYVFSQYKALLSNLSRASADGSYSEAVLFQAAKEDKQLQEDWISETLERRDDPSWQSKSEHEMIVSFLEMKKKVLESQVHLLIVEARREFAAVKQDSGGCESYQFFRQFKDTAKMLKILTKNHGTEDSRVATEKAMVTECVQRLTPCVQQYITRMCMVNITVHKLDAWKDMVPPTMNDLEAIVSQYATSKATEIVETKKSSGKDDGSKSAFDKFKKSKEWRAMEASVAEVKSLREELQKATSSGSGAGGGGKPSGQKAGGGRGAAGGGGTRTPLTPHDIMPSVFGEGEGEFPPMLKTGETESLAKPKDGKVYKVCVKMWNGKECKGCRYLHPTKEECKAIAKHFKCTCPAIKEEDDGDEDGDEFHDTSSTALITKEAADEEVRSLQSKQKQEKKQIKSLKRQIKKLQLKAAAEESEESADETDEDESPWMSMCELEETPEQLQEFADEIQNVQTRVSNRNSAKQCYIEGNLSQSGEAFTFMVDSGANTIVVVEEESYKRWRSKNPIDFVEPKPLKNVVRARTAGKGSSVELTHSGYFEVNFQGQDVPIRCVLMRGGTTGAALAMIGNDFCYKKMCVLDFAKEVFHIYAPLGEGDDVKALDLESVTTSIITGKELSSEPISGIPVQKMVRIGFNGKAQGGTSKSYLNQVLVPEKLSKVCKDSLEEHEREYLKGATTKGALDEVKKITDDIGKRESSGWEADKVMEYQGASHPKLLKSKSMIMQAVRFVCMCAVAIPASTTVMLKGVVRSRDHAVPGGAFTFGDSALKGVKVSDTVLFKPGLDGTLILPVTNENEYGLAFDDGDLISSLTYEPYATELTNDSYNSYYNYMSETDQEGGKHLLHLNSKTEQLQGGRSRMREVAALMVDAWTHAFPSDDEGGCPGGIFQCNDKHIDKHMMQVQRGIDRFQLHRLQEKAAQRDADRIRLNRQAWGHAFHSSGGVVKGYEDDDIFQKSDDDQATCANPCGGNGTLQPHIHAVCGWDVNDIHTVTCGDGCLMRPRLSPCPYECSGTRDDIMSATATKPAHISWDPSVEDKNSSTVGGSQKSIHPSKLKKWGTKSVREVKPFKHNATFEDWLSGHYAIQSFDPAIWARDDVKPVVVFCSGIGGVEEGIARFNSSNKSADGMYYVPAVAIDADGASCQTHKVNHPGTPVVQHYCQTWKATLSIVNKYLPKEYWKKAWVHTSNSCKESSTTNFTARDIAVGKRATEWFILMMQRMRPDVWTLENIAGLYKYFSGRFPTVKVFKLNDHCQLAQDRKRMIISNRALYLDKFQGESLTFRDVLGDRLELDPKVRYWQENSWCRHRTVDRPAFTVTSGMHRAGATRVGDLDETHTLNSSHRAVLQGWGKVKYPANVTETRRRDLIAQVVPPPFAEALAKAVTDEKRDRERISSLEVCLVQLKKIPEKDVEAMFKDFETMAKTEAVDLQQHGKWTYFGEAFGWVRQDLATKPVMAALLHSPWYIVRELPRLNETVTEWRARNAQRALEAQLEYTECFDMGDNDLDAATGSTRSKPKPKRSQLFRNLCKAPDEKARWDSNSALQKSDPENYGPYLDEGESYAKPRSKENLDEACKTMGLDEEHIEQWVGEREYYRKLIYDHWIMFDGRNRKVLGVEIDIDVDGITPINLHPYRWSPAKMEAFGPIIEEFIRDGIVKPGCSQWSFPASLVPKPNGAGWRLVVDLRKLNEVTDQDMYEPPSCDICLEWMMQNGYRTVFDLAWGFHQLALTEESMNVFTFTTPRGCYSYTRLAMGYINATAIFQRVVNHTFGDSLWRNAVLMVDDGAIGSKTLAQHRIDNLENWTKMAERHHSVKPKKMSILPREVKYLGHVVTQDGIRPSDTHVKAIKDMPEPLLPDGSVDESGVRSFLGLVKYLRRYIRNCGQLCAGLNELLTQDSDKVWTMAHQCVFDKLKDDIVESKGVYSLDIKQPVYLCTDGSKLGVGGYIYQKINGEERIVSYYSRSTTKDEKKWDTRELEVLAIIVTLEHFNVLIDGLPITVQTDHRNLKWLMDMKDPSGRLGRWVLRLQRHRFNLEYRAGKANEVADALSRLPLKADDPAPPLNNFYGDNTEEVEALLIQLTEVQEGSAHYELLLPDFGDRNDGDLSRRDESSAEGKSHISSLRESTPVEISTYKPKPISNRTYGCGQRARFKVKPHRPGFIVQRVRRVAKLANDELVDVSSSVPHCDQNYTEAWKVNSDKIEQKGDDSFLVPHGWLKDYHGSLTITTDAWWQPTLPDGFSRDDTLDSPWGTLMGTSEYLDTPNGKPLWHREWRAVWSKGEEPDCSMFGARAEALCLESGSSETEVQDVASDVCGVSSDDCDLQAFLHEEMEDYEVINAIMPQSELPDKLQVQPVSLEMIRQAQAEDPECIGLRLKLQHGDKRVAKQFEDVDEILYKVTHADIASDGGVDTMRPALPKKLRPQVMHNAHNTIWGGHTGLNATVKKITEQYYWPSLQKDVEQFVTSCEECQLAKGTKPHRHGLMLGHKYTEPGTHICMDLVGPIDTDTPGGSNANTILVVFDPSTHFPYFIPVQGKTATEIADAFVEKVLLEQGASVSILTDNGTEFRNKLMRKLMELLETRHDFTPSYHARGNMVERTNRWLGDTLRTIMNHAGMKKADWNKMVKYLEFVYRRTPISGTNITPFEAMRGRKPRMPSSLELESNESASAYKSLNDTADEVRLYLQLANKLVAHSFEKHRSKSRDEFNQHQIRVDFEVGETVRFWNRVPARKGQGSSKLKLRNAVYEVTGIRGTMVDLIDSDTKAKRTAHVSQLARFKRPVTEGATVRRERVEKSVVVDRDDSKIWDKVKVGDMIVFHIKGEPASHIRLAEVLEYNPDDKFVQVWYYMHASSKYNVELPMVKWLATPEWYNDKNQAVFYPKADAKHALYQRDADFQGGEINIIAAGFSLQRQKVPPATLKVLDKWLKEAAKNDRRSLKVINFDDDEE